MLTTTERGYASGMNRDEGKDGRADGADKAMDKAVEKLSAASVPTKKRRPVVLSASPQGVRIPRKNTREGVDPMSEAAGIVWELRSSSISDANGKSLFKQDNIEVPASWSQQATNIVANKYFRGIVGTPERESSVRALILRVADTMTHWGRRRRYFATEADAEAFHAELCHLLVTQKVAFNSPVWFNVGVEAAPQCSACFINSVDDTMESILGLAKTEGMLFKYGSGAGSNLSPIRSSKELLAGGGTASGPVSFMRGFDAPRGQDGDPQRRAPRRPRVRRQQDDRGEEGVGAHRGRLQRRLQRARRRL
jgi:ribonucleoside-diphosphate reductase alpha chain